MATSQNGFKAGLVKGQMTTLTVPGTSTKMPVLAGDVATVLLWVATRWHHEIEPLKEPGNWGYAYREIRGSTTGLSNHASGTAIDLNAPAHPLGTEPAKTMSKAQIATAKRIEADSGGVVRWGGSYSGRKDPMHWEINASPARVAAFAAQLRTKGPVASSPTAATPTAPREGFLMALSSEQQDDLYRRVVKIDQWMDDASVDASTGQPRGFAQRIGVVHQWVTSSGNGVADRIGRLVAKLGA